MKQQGQRHTTTVPTLLPAPGSGVTREEAPRGQGSSRESWGSHAAGAGAGRCQLLGLASWAEANIPSHFSSAATHCQRASLPVHVSSSKISHLHKFSPSWAPRSALGKLPLGREIQPLAGTRMGVMPEPPLHILLCTQSAHSCLATPTLETIIPRKTPP